ncbi:MAG TPA: chaperone modulator CbpM [Steroidobacteraceae bacterium]|nr:chaperone modulator CbpM [Steroidobacteraceae bacterium]
MTDPIELTEAHLIGESDWLSVETLLRLCDLNLEALVEFADLGVVSPRGYAPAEWQLPATALPRLRTMARLMRDLGLNANGAALALELIETQRRLERRLRALERHLHPGRLLPPRSSR